MFLKRKTTEFINVRRGGAYINELRTVGREGHVRSTGKYLAFYNSSLFRFAF